MNRSLRFGVHAGPSDVPYATRREYWCEAERLGYDWASVGDHFIANPVFGARDTDPWNEVWTSSPRGAWSLASALDIWRPNTACMAFVFRPRPCVWSSWMKQSRSANHCGRRSDLILSGSTIR